MNFLGMGPAELVLVAALALIVFGPDKLPEIARQIGRVVGDLRRVSTDVTREIQRGIQEEPLTSGPRIVRQPPTSNPPTETSEPSAPQPVQPTAAVTPSETPSILPPSSDPRPATAPTTGAWEDAAAQPQPADRPPDPRRPV
jgi:Tat protein translocase TatB subunit